MTELAQSSIEPGGRAGTPLGWSANDLEGSVTTRLMDVATHSPDALALTGVDGTSLTFGELRSAVLSLAEEIVARLGTGPGRVATFVDPHPGAVIGILGILAAGKTYVPIDPTEAESRSVAKIRHADAELLVAPQLLTGRAVDLVGRESVVRRDATRATTSTSAPVAGAPDDLFNLTFTSGSTGLPKGVVQLHRNVLYETASGARVMRTRTSDRFGLVVPLTFGASVSDMLGSLLNGASLHVFDLRTFGAAAMAEWMGSQQITATHMVPTIFRRWMAELSDDDRYPAMRAIKLGGESVLHTDIAAFNQHFGPGCLLRNGLGTTETFLVTSLILATGDPVESGVVPVGYPVDGKDVAITDDEGLRVPDGEIGHITVISDYLSPGYWKDEETTSLKYGVDAATGTRTYRPGDLGRIRHDGMLEHLGRSDDVVKINGSRVETGEVEAIILEHPGVAETVVVDQPGADGAARLVAYVVPADESGAALTPGALRELFPGQVPSHMIPTALVQMDALPVLAFGKVDRRSLPLPDGQRPDLGVPYRPPSSIGEKAIVDTAATTLGLEAVGADDNLFDLGLDSLLATRLVVDAGLALAVEISVDDLFEHPTAARLARHLDERVESTGGDIDDLAALVAEIEALDDIAGADL